MRTHFVLGADACHSGDYGFYTATCHVGREVDFAHVDALHLVGLFLELGDNKVVELLSLGIELGIEGHVTLRLDEATAHIAVADAGENHHHCVALRHR